MKNKTLNLILCMVFVFTFPWSTARADDLIPKDILNVLDERYEAYPKVKQALKGIFKGYLELALMNPDNYHEVLAGSTRLDQAKTCLKQSVDDDDMLYRALLSEADDLWSRDPRRAMRLDNFFSKRGGFTYHSSERPDCEWLAERKF